jgi:HK97 family phage prohead protease
MRTERRDARGVVELRADPDTPGTLAGYAALFERTSADLGGFVERIDARAFADTLARGGNVLGVVNHDPSWLLGTRASGTLDVRTDDRGLAYEITLDPDDPDAVRAAAKVRTGKMRGSSFAFRSIADEWGTLDDGTPVRRLLSVALFDVGPVATPAYPDTETDGTVALRSLAQAVDAELDVVVDAARSGNLGRFIGTRGVTAEIVSPSSETVEDTTPRSPQVVNLAHRHALEARRPHPRRPA